ncbi:MAG TPA: hypothetical protein VMT43_06655, partial [Acidimicrobiales bacterium]|nr:hypothetical protein [Acidimicrobiales bacterium]
MPDPMAGTTTTSGAPSSVSTAPERVTRAPSDVLRLVVALVLLVGFVLVGLLFGGSVVGFAAALLRGLSALPSWLVTTVVVAVQVAAVVLAVAALVAVVRTRSWRLVVEALIGAAIGAATAVLLGHLVDASAARVTHLTPVAVVGQGSRVGVAVLGGLTASLAVVAPWIPRRWRRLGWTTLLVVAIGHFVADPVSFDTVLALLAGWTGGTLVTVLAGSPSHRPTAVSIINGLRAVGLPLVELEPASVDARGSTPWFGEDGAHHRYFVKAL